MAKRLNYSSSESCSVDQPCEKKKSHDERVLFQIGINQKFGCKDHNGIFCGDRIKISKETFETSKATSGQAVYWKTKYDELLFHSTAPLELLPEDGVVWDAHNNIEIGLRGGDRINIPKETFVSLKRPLDKLSIGKRSMTSSFFIRLLTFQSLPEDDVVSDADISIIDATQESSLSELTPKKSRGHARKEYEKNRRSKRRQKKAQKRVKHEREGEKQQK